MGSSLRNVIKISVHALAFGLYLDKHGFSLKSSDMNVYTTFSAGKKFFLLRNVYCADVDRGAFTTAGAFK